jgi:hypothetical protein
MTFQIFSELKPSQYNTLRMYTAPFGSNVGARGTLLMVNQGNPEVNNGNLALDLGRDTDYIRVGLSSNLILYQDGYVMYDTLVPPNEMTQLQDINLASGQSLFVYSQKGYVSFVFTGSTVSV